MFIANKVVRRLFHQNSATFIKLCCIWVLVSSGLDAYLAFHYRKVILLLEKNPVCLWLMEIEPKYLSIFLFSKLLTTLVVVGVIALLYRYRASVGLKVAIGVSCFQVALLAYQLLA